MKKLIPILLLAGSAILSGCGDSNDYSQVSGQQGNPNPFVPSVPVAVDDVYATDEDDAITLTAAQGVLANDQVNDETQFVSVDFPTATAQGGTITQVADTGAFTYTPALGFTGTDSFTYTLNNREGSDTATVTIEVDAAIVAQGYFVDSANGNDTTADFDTGAPYATIQAAVLAAPVNSDVVVRPGNYTGAVTLKDGQRLLGSGSTLVNAQGTVRPILTGNIILGDGNTVDFFRIEDAPGDAIEGNDQNGGTITNCQIIDSAARGVGVVPGTGNWSVTDNTVTNSGGIGIRLDTDGTGQMRAQVNGNSINGSTLGAVGLLAGTNSQQVTQLNGNIMANNLDMATVETISGTAATLSLDIEDNTNDDAYSFARAATAFLNVEQLDQLIALNNDSGTVDIVVPTPAFLPPDDVPNGFCGF